MTCRPTRNDRHGNCDVLIHEVGLFNCRFIMSMKILNKLFFNYVTSTKASIHQQLSMNALTPCRNGAHPGWWRSYSRAWPAPATHMPSSKNIHRELLSNHVLTEAAKASRVCFLSCRVQLGFPGTFTRQPPGFTKFLNTVLCIITGYVFPNTVLRQKADQLYFPRISVT